MLKFGSFGAKIMAIGLAFTLTALAADSNVDASKSKITATFKQEGVAVKVPFLKFSGHIAYDPKNAAAATAAIDVVTGSLDLGDEGYNAEVRGKEWFDSDTYPTATFRSTAIKAGAAGKFDATGKLTIKGKVLTITVPITVQPSAVGNIFDGSFVFSRSAFGVGNPSWKEIIDDKVTIHFHLVSTSK
ncbi:MAG: YceI family protein [Steroidobacteraceae bacterium]